MLDSRGELGAGAPSGFQLSVKLLGTVLTIGSNKLLHVLIVVDKLSRKLVASFDEIRLDLGETGGRDVVADETEVERSDEVSLEIVVGRANGVAEVVVGNLERFQTLANRGAMLRNGTALVVI